LLVLACLSSLVYASSDNNNRVDCDVAILGGGAAGSASAVFLKDKGYSVCLFERRGRLGGNCNSYTIPSNEIPSNCPTCPTWTEVGVKYYENSTYLNNAGIGQWNFATDKFVTRFAPSGSVRAVSFSDYPSDLSGVFDFNLSIGPILGAAAASPDASFLSAYGRLYGVLLRYNWIDQIDGVPQTIPAELLLPITTFIQNYNLYPLVNPIFGPLLVAQGILDWENTPTLYALYNVKRSLLELIQPTKSGLRIDGGCNKVFEGIRSYLGSSVYLNSEVTQIDRPNGNNNNGVIKVKVNINGDEQEFKVNHVIIAFAPKTSSMTFLDADDTEKALFAKVRTRIYWPSIVNVAGAITQNNFAFFNFRFSNPPYYYPIAPAVVLYVKEWRYGPAVSFTVYDDQQGEPTRQEAIDFVNSQLNQLPRGLFTAASTDNVFRHQYEPYFSTQTLSESPNPFVQFRNRQGVRNTWYVGGLLAAPGSSAGIFEHAYNLINQNF